MISFDFSVVATGEGGGQKAQSFWRDTGKARFFFGLLFILAIGVYLGTTGVLPLMGRDEPRYVQIGREMLESGDWITPRLGGSTWFEKPVLLYWMVAASFGVLGVSEWAARLPSALCGLGTAFLVWWTMRLVNQKWAFWSALVLLSSGGLIAFSHGATFDIVLTFCLTLALASWWKAQIEPAKATRFLALFWVGIGLAFLAKGLVAFVLPLGTVGIYWLVRREKTRVELLWGVPLSLAVAALWYGPVIAADGVAFVREFFLEHHFQRFTSNKFKHHQPPWFYLEILPLLILPWTPFLLVALAKIRRGFWRAEGPEAGLRVFALLWMLVPVAFFSISGSKLPGYILPALPGAAILAGIAVSDWASSVRRVVSMGVLAGLVFGAATVLTLFDPAVSHAQSLSTRSLFHVARERGLANLRVAHFATLNRSAEFYGAATLLYNAHGEPLRLETPAQARELAGGEPMLFLVEKEARPLLAQSGLRLQDLAQSGKFLLVFARPASHLRALP